MTLVYKSLKTIVQHFWRPNETRTCVCTIWFLFDFFFFFTSLYDTTTRDGQTTMKMDLINTGAVVFFFNQTRVVVSHEEYYIIFVTRSCYYCYFNNSNKIQSKKNDNIMFRRVWLKRGGRWLFSFFQRVGLKFTRISNNRLIHVSVSLLNASVFFI